MDWFGVTSAPLVPAWDEPPFGRDKREQRRDDRAATRDVPAVERARNSSQLR
jgi:hypothetical protein